MSVAVIRAVFLDVGETILDEARAYWAWADWLDVPRHTFSAVLGAVVARGGEPREALEVFRPRFDLAGERQRRAAAGLGEDWGEESLYPDARPCLAALQAMGLQVGLAGNQTHEAEALLRAMDLPADVICTSAAWGVEKPSAEFFARVVDQAGCSPASVLYVGDRVDNDIAPAQRRGLATAFVRRGPRGYLRSDPGVEAACLFRLPGLVELPEAVRRHNRDVGLGSGTGAPPRG